MHLLKEQRQNGDEHVHEHQQQDGIGKPEEPRRQRRADRGQLRVVKVACEVEQPAS